MLLFCLSLLALFLGPALVGLLWRWPALSAGLDGFVLIAIGGLVGWHIVPQAFEYAGYWALLALAFGLFLPRFLEPSKVLQKGNGHHHSLGILLAAVLGLSVHTLMDGGALALGDHHHGHALALSIVLHRLPMSIAVWWAVRPVLGRNLAAALVLVMALGTTLGFWLGAQHHALLESAPLGLFQAAMAGSLLHVVWHPPLPITNQRASRWLSVLGAIIGLLVLYALALTHPSTDPINELSARHTFLTLALESAPALLLAFLGAGLLIGLVRPSSMGFLHGRTRLGQGLRGVAFGLPLPLCSCGVLPVYKSLAKAGVPITAGFAFLIATPELGIDAVLVSVPLLGVDFTLWRVAAAALVALATALLLGAMARPTPVSKPSSTDVSAQMPLAARLRRGMAYGFGDLFDSTAPWMLAGLIIAAFAEPMLKSAWVQQLPAGLDVPILALVGIPAYICASGATPLAAVLLHKGVSAGAVIAMLLTGPATNITTFGILANLHGRRVALAFAIIVGAAACIAGWLVNVAQPNLQGLSLHEHAEHGPTFWSSLSLSILVVLFFLSLLRQGLRGMLGQVIAPFAAHEHQHHGDTHDHSHHGQPLCTDEQCNPLHGVSS